MAVSDLALLKPLPPRLRKSVEALVGCVAGAVQVDTTRRMLRAAGLVKVVLTPRADYVDNMAEWNDPFYRRILKALPRGARLGDYVTSLEVEARKA